MAIFLYFFALGFQSVKIVDPIGFQKVDQEDDGAEAPGNGIGPGDGSQLIDEFDGNGNIADADDTPANEHGDHGDRGLACAAHNGGHAVGKCQQAIKQADGPHVHSAEINGQFVAGEESNEFGSQHIFCHTNELCHQTGAKNAETHTFFNTVIVLGTQVLANESGQSHGEASDRQKCEALDFLMGTATGHGSIAEGIDVGLYHQIGKANDGILHTGRQTELDDGFQECGVETNLTESKTVIFRNTAHQAETAEQGADTLGNGGSQSRRTDTKAKIAHQQKIQSNVDEGGENQVVQRVLAVTDGVEDANKNIVHHGKEHAVGVISEIGDGLGQNTVGRLHPTQDGGGECDTQHRQQDACCQTESNIGMHGPFQGIMIFGTETFCDQNTGTHGNALKEAHHHMDQAGRGTDRRQCGVTQVSAYDPGVEGIIKLLKKIAKENGEREQQYFGPNGTFGEILTGGLCLVLMIVKAVAVEWHVRHILKETLGSVIPREAGKVKCSAPAGNRKSGHTSTGGIRMTEREYGKLVREMSPNSPMWKDCFNAFWIGGLICTLGQVLVNWYSNWGLNKTDAGTATSMTLVALSALLTGLSLYDNIAKHGGAGTLVPITGFANAIAAPAVEFKTEGFILGVGAKMFTIAGPVIVYGVSASVVYGFIYWIWTMM